MEYERSGAAIDDRQHNWRVWLVCCGRFDGSVITRTWEEADSFRDIYTSGPGVEPTGYQAPAICGGHRRAGIITRIDAANPFGVRDD